MQNMRQLRVSLFITLSIILILFGSVTAASPAIKQASNQAVNQAVNHAPIKSLNSIVATVGSSIITQDQLNSQVALIRRQLKGQKRQVPPAKVLNRQVLNQLISQELQLQQAKKDSITVSNAQLNGAIANIAKQNNVSPTVLKMEVEKQGLSYSDYRERIRKQLLMNGAQREAVAKKIIVTKQEIQEALKSVHKESQQIPEYHLQAILVPVPSTPSPDQVDAAKKQADEIFVQLNQGANFNNVAITQSADRQALEGGDMGWKQLTQLPPAIASQVAAAATGSIVGPIQSPNGFYVIKVAAIRNSSANHTVTLTHVRHILLKQGQLDTGDSIKAKLDVIRKKIKKGASFAKMAKRYSQDINTADRGGNLGWVAANEVPLAFAQRMVNMKRGEVSHSIQTKDGWELIQVLGRKKVDNSERNLENRVRQMLFERKFIQAVNAWVEQLKGSTYIQIMLDS